MSIPPRSVLLSYLFSGRCNFCTSDTPARPSFLAFFGALATFRLRSLCGLVAMFAPASLLL